MKKRIISVVLASCMMLGLVACSASSEYLDSLQVGIDQDIIDKDEAEELTVFLSENITEDTQAAMPEGEMTEGQLPEGELPEGELPEGELPEGELPEGELPEGEMSEGMMPGMGSVEVNPFLGAVEEDIITNEQAEELILVVDLEAIMEELGVEIDTDSGMESSMSEGMPSTSNSLTIEEAEALEAELLEAVGYTAEVGGYPIVDTNQTLFYSNDAIIDEPEEGEAFFGQDAQYVDNAPSYTDNDDGTVSDNVTGLMWTQDPGEKMTWTEAIEYLEYVNETSYLGYDDWRIPTIKELYSLVDFSGVTGTSSDESTPYIDTDYFVFTYGDEAGEARFIDSQILTSTIYGAETLGGNTTVFGYNFADGRIKGYEIDKDFYCYLVRGNTSYGQNLFVDNEDDTITDEATGLMWTQYDSGYYEAGDYENGTFTWEDALAWVEEMNEQNFLGYDDWRLPDIKELQSLGDYEETTIITGEAGIDDLFYCTSITNFLDMDDYAYYWSGTTHDDLSASETQYGAACYMVFGLAMGEMDGQAVDAHGTGSQKSDPKTGDYEDYPAADPNAPQGDEQRVYNMVRLVRYADDDE